MIFYLIMCQILLSLLHSSYSYKNEDQLINRRCAHGIDYKSQLHRWNRKTRESSNPGDSSLPIKKAETRYYKISKNLSRHNLDTNDIAKPVLLTSNDKGFKREVVTENFYNLDMDLTDIKTESSNVQLNSNDISFFESYRFCTTTKRPRFISIENPPETRPLNLKFPKTEIRESETQKVKQRIDEITVLPVTYTYASQAVNLVFPLEGEPPPQYRCFEVKKYNLSNNSKLVKIYKLISPPPFEVITNKAMSNKTLIKKEKMETTTPSLKVKRQGYWIELQSPLSTEIYSKQQLSKSKVMNIFKTKNKCKKQKTKKNKKKKSSRLHETTETTTNSNDVIRTTDLQTEPPPHDIEPDKCAIMTNETQKFDLMNKDREKIFIKSKEYDHNMTSPHQINGSNATDQPQAEKSLNNDTLSAPPPDKDKVSIKPQKEDKSVKDKPFINDKIWDKSSIPSSIKELFYRSTCKPISTDNPTTSLSTKFIYGHELHV